MGGRDVDDAAFAATATHGKPCDALLLVARHAQPRHAMSRPVSENCVCESAAFMESAACTATSSQALPGLHRGRFRNLTRADELGLSLRIPGTGGVIRL